MALVPLKLVTMLLEVEPEVERSLFSADEVGGYAVTALFTIINLLVAYIVIKKFVFKPIMGIINKREELINSQIADAEKSKAEAAAHEEESRKAIESARIEAASIVDASKETAEKQAEVILAKAKEEAADIIRRAEEDSKRMKKAALDEMKDELSDLAVVIAGRVLGDALSAEELKPIADKQTAEVLKNEVNKLG